MAQVNNHSGLSLWEQSQFLSEGSEFAIKDLAKRSRKYLNLLHKIGVHRLPFKKINEVVQEMKVVGPNYDLRPLRGYFVLDCNGHAQPLQIVHGADAIEH
jgi:hypothetical protein